MKIHLKNLLPFKSLLLLFCLLGPFNIGFSQMITGVWKGKIDNRKAEIKIIKNGDSLTGTSYYYESGDNYRRYTIKGYFDPATNMAVWWDDQLIDSKTPKLNIKAAGKNQYLSVADFNCPGNDKMYLDGKAYMQKTEKGQVHLEKTSYTQFPDEWDFIIDNYTAGANDPYFIDSVAGISLTPVQLPEKISENEKKINNSVLEKKEERQPVMAPEKPRVLPVEKPVDPAVSEPNPTEQIEQKFKQRERIKVLEIPVSGDSIELRFYDNAEIDGDSISLFLNDKLIFQHIRLTASAYTIKLPVKDLLPTNELVMVAENLGSIPPNTSYMIAYCSGKRHEAMLRSTEQSSAVIRLVKNE
jgi:hypothetical protein